MSKNPFQNSQSTPKGGQNFEFGGASAKPQRFSQTEILDRSYSRNYIRRDEQLSKKAQYRHFIDTQQEASSLMAKSAGRKMGIDTKRPVHRLWLGTMGVMTTYLVFKWVYTLSQPRFYKILNLPEKGFAVSMMSEDELELLGPLPPPVDMRGGVSAVSQQELAELKQKRARFGDMPKEEQDLTVPCYSHGQQFKTCMSYDQLHRKLDQCMLPLQNYNKCMLDWRTKPITNAVSQMNNDAQAVTQAAIGYLPQQTESYIIKTNHDDYKY